MGVGVRGVCGGMGCKGGYGVYGWCPAGEGGQGVVLPFPADGCCGTCPSSPPPSKQDPDATVSVAQLVLLTHISNIGCSLSAAATFCILLVCCFSR